MMPHTRTLRNLALAGVLCVAAVPTLAQQPSTEKPPTTEEQKRTLEYLKVLIGALQSDKIEEPVKGALVGCIYSNSLRMIGQAMDETISKAPASFDRTNPSNLLGVMARVCGYKPEKEAATPSPSSTPAPAVPGR